VVGLMPCVHRCHQHVKFRGDLKDVCSAPLQAEKLQRSFENFLRLSRGESRFWKND
jgi:hypothetical protein